MGKFMGFLFSYFSLIYPAINLDAPATIKKRVDVRLAGGITCKLICHQIGIMRRVHVII